MEVILNSENFDKEVLRSEIPVLVDFWAEWCMPCHAIAPILSQMSKTYESIFKVGKLNVDLEPQLAEAYQVRSIPNLKIFHKGQLVDELVGVHPQEEIVNRIKKYL